jgi:hypothetical protein
MKKVKKFMVTIPHRLGIPHHIAESCAETFALLYDKAREDKEGAFRRLGNKKAQCEERLFPVFTILDGLVQDYGANSDVVKEAKQLLVLASTPEIEEQALTVDSYQATTTVYSDVMTQNEAVEIGTRGFWNQ